MAGTRKSKINLEEVAEKLTAAAGTTDAGQARSAKKRTGKRAAKGKARRARGKKEQAQTVPKKRARAKKSEVADAQVEPGPEAAPQVDGPSSPPVADAAPGAGEAVDRSADEPVELSPEEALEFLAGLSGSQDGPPAEGRTDESADSGPAADVEASETGAPAAEAQGDWDSCGDPGILASILDASCRVLTFEGESVDDGMCVAREAIERLRHMVARCGLGVSIGPICRTPEEFIAEWDNTPSSMPVAIIANLSCAGAFLPAVVDERPRVASAYWIVFETLRSEVSTATSAFLSELRSRHRLRAIGFGPRNMTAAARGGAEAVRGHVEWGFGQGPVPVAS